MHMSHVTGRWKMQLSGTCPRFTRSAFPNTMHVLKQWPSSQHCPHLTTLRRTFHTLDGRLPPCFLHSLLHRYIGNGYYALLCYQCVFSHTCYTTAVMPGGIFSPFARHFDHGSDDGVLRRHGQGLQRLQSRAGRDYYWRWGDAEPDQGKYCRTPISNHD